MRLLANACEEIDSTNIVLISLSGRACASRWRIWHKVTFEERAPSLHQFSTRTLGLSAKHHNRFLLTQSCKSESRSESRCRRRHTLRLLKHSRSCPPRLLFTLFRFPFGFSSLSPLSALCLSRPLRPLVALFPPFDFTFNSLFSPFFSLPAQLGRFRYSPQPALFRRRRPKCRIMLLNRIEAKHDKKRKQL
jgi:hypothetical protein